MPAQSKRTYPCPKCPKFYSRNLNLQIHIRSIHSGEQPFQCGHCDKRFASQDSRAKHEVSIHSETRKYSCHACALSFAQSTTLKRHEKSKAHKFAVNSNVRLAERPLDTERSTSSEATKSVTFAGVVQQGVGSRQSDTAEAHLLQSQPFSRNVEIESPDIAIQSIQRLPSSSTSHPNPDIRLGPSSKRHGSFECFLCPKRFTRAFNLRTHLRTHYDERPFVCAACGKAFARLHDLKRHEILHLGEKNFVCRGTLPISRKAWGCGRKFARSDALGRHFRADAGRRCIESLLSEEKTLESIGIPHVEFHPFRRLQIQP